MDLIEAYQPDLDLVPDVVLSPLREEVKKPLMEIGERLQKAGLGVRFDHRHLPFSSKIADYEEDEIEFALIGRPDDIAEGRVGIKQRDMVWGRYGYPIEGVIATVMEHFRVAPDGSRTTG